MIMTDYPDWQTPQEHANKIATTGAPLLGFKNVLGSNAAGLAIPATATRNLVTNMTVNQVAYEMAFSISTAAGTASGLIIVAQWTDSVSGLLTDTQTWSVFAGTTIAPHTLRITGPSNGDQLTVFIVNGANAITVAFSIMQTSRVYTRHFGHTINLNQIQPSFPGFTFASCDPSSGVLCAESDAVALSSSASRLLPLYSGTARAWGRASLATGTDSEWRLTYSSALLTLGDSIPYQVEGNQGFSPAGQGSSEIDNVAMPRSQMILQLFNHNAAGANTLVFHLVAREIAA